MESYTSYPHIYALGHAALTDLFQEEVLVEEKVDGSQFSFGLFDHPEQGEILKARSRGSELNILAPEKMFASAIETVIRLKPLLHKGWTYRGEVLSKPKHNTLAYDRVPKGNIILFDIAVGLEAYAPYDVKAAEAARLGLEVVPVVHHGKVVDIDIFRGLLDRVSILGGQKIEGVVVKNYVRFDRAKKPLMGKFVSEQFKEKHGVEWRENNPSGKDVIARLILMYRTPARWAKAVQHLREAGQLENSPRDIGKIIPELARDLEEECGAEIREALYKWAKDDVRRGVVGGVAEWYKEELLKLQFENTVIPEGT